MKRLFHQKSKGQFTGLARGIVAFLFLLNSIGMPSLAIAQNLTTGAELLLPTIVTPSDKAFRPPIIQGLTLYPTDPLKFDFIVDLGDKNLKGQALVKEADRLIKYFMAALTIPEKDLWVNLSPYEKDSIIPQAFGETVMGRDLLAQDYILKQLTAAIVHPENKFGFQFWKRVYAKAQERYGTTDIPMATFDRIWIVPAKAVVFEYEGSVYIVESRLKVLLDEDYVALKHNIENAQPTINQQETKKMEDINEFSSEMMREVILPEVEREVNEGSNFAETRQIYHSLILAMWYKKNLKQSLLGKIYINQNKTPGVDVKDKLIAYKIYNQYLEMFKKGVYNYIREDYNSETKDILPRKYYSGGQWLAEIDTILESFAEQIDLLDNQQFMQFLRALTEEKLATIPADKQQDFLVAIQQRYDRLSPTEKDEIREEHNRVRRVIVSFTPVEGKGGEGSRIVIIDRPAVSPGESLIVPSEEPVALPGSIDTEESPAATRGGIDFDPNILNLQVKRDKRGIPLPIANQPLLKMKVDGFLPVILKIEPMTPVYPVLSKDDNKKPKPSKKESSNSDREEKISLNLK